MKLANGRDVWKTMRDSNKMIDKLAAALIAPPRRYEMKCPDPNCKAENLVFETPEEACDGSYVSAHFICLSCLLAGSIKFTDGKFTKLNRRINIKLKP